MRRHPLLGNSHSTGHLTNYSFKGSSGSILQLSNKQNIGIVRNTNSKDREHQRKQSVKRRPIFYEKESEQLKGSHKFVYGEARRAPERSNSADIRVVSSHNFQSQRNKMTESQIVGQGKSVRSRKKSVRFSEQSLELLDRFDVKKMLSIKDKKQTSELPRNRSNSILKNKLAAPRCMKTKSTSMMKMKQSKQGSSGFSISEYKNTMVREKYNQLLKHFNKKDEAVTSPSGYLSFKYGQSQGQFTDNSFPLTLANIFNTKKVSLGKVRWMRLSELYQGRKLTVMRKGQEDSNAVSLKEAQSFANINFVNMLNLMKNSRSLLYKIFQNATYHQSGVYMLKIFQSHEWKCVIIDDYVPVIEEGGKTKPLFTSLKQVSGNQQLEIWPLLLEKVYAVMLGCYESVHNYDLQSNWVQLMGLPVHKINLGKSKKGWKEEVKSLKKESIVFGYRKIQSEEPKQPRRIVISEENRDSIYCQGVQTKQITRLSLCDLNKVFSEVFVININSLQYYTSVNISNPSRFGQAIKNKRCFNDPENLHNSKAVQIKRERPLVKKFVVSSHEEISIILKRKVVGKQGRPVWLRAFLFMKELSSFRWIHGKYSCECISFSSVLEPGEYYVVVVPDWTAEPMGELMLMLYSRMQALQIISSDQGVQGMIEKGCSDYVQRFGGMVQVNKWVCTYAMVDIQSGMMIENINNERRHGKVKIFRSINSLKPNNSHLLPLNDQFYATGQLKNDLELNMTRDQSYTVVLMLFGGRDDTFLNTFNFGV